MWNYFYIIINKIIDNVLYWINEFIFFVSIIWNEFTSLHFFYILAFIYICLSIVDLFIDYRKNRSTIKRNNIPVIKIYYLIQLLIHFLLGRGAALILHDIIQLLTALLMIYLIKLMISLIHLINPWVVLIIIIIKLIIICLIYIIKSK